MLPPRRAHLRGALLLTGILAACSSHPPAGTCGAGTSACGAACVDLKSNAANCGRCGEACGTSEACVDGACTLVCQSGRVPCGGACIDPLTSASHCGARGRCTSPTSTDADFEGLSCGSSEPCRDGLCELPASVCGNGVKEPGEQCDLGALNDTGQGCSTSCHLDCATDMDCDDGEACDGAETCVPDTVLDQPVQRCQPGTSAAKCAPCVSGFCDGSGRCAASACGDGCVDASRGEQCDPPDGTRCDVQCKLSPNCGNGIVDPGEACDLGALNGTGAGCSSGCLLDCTADANCDDGNPCDGAETCVAATVLGQAVRRCQAGVNAARCAACAAGLCDGAGQCAASTCGDGCVDAGRGEQCDPPDGTACDAQCRLVPVCGNGVLEAGEQCDDGNLFDLDGCDARCRYEVVARLTSLSIQGGPAPLFCTPATNRLGAQSFTGTLLAQANPQLQTSFSNGTNNVLLQFLGLDDLTGVADANGLGLGILRGTLDPSRGAWPGTGNPLDWWFLGDGQDLAAGLPTNLATATLAARALSSGPDDLDLRISLLGSAAVLKMRSARIAATINGTPAPNVPAPPPAQLAAGLTVFQTVTASGANQGLCGNITVDSLAQIPVPEILATGTLACVGCAGSHSYTSCGSSAPVGPGCNSLLDVLVGGCKVLGCLVAVVDAQQPDVPAVAGGSVTPLTLGAGNKVPTSQSAGDLDAYSAWLKFDANRGHLTGQTCQGSDQCQTGKSCVSGVCR